MRSIIPILTTDQVSSSLETGLEISGDIYLLPDVVAISLLPNTEKLRPRDLDFFISLVC